MQKKLLPAALLFLSISSFAQPILTNSCNPLNNDTHTYYKCDSVGPGASGANVTWNYTNLNAIDTYVLTYKTCPGWAECDTFPGSNMSLAQDTSNGGYYKMSPTKFAWNGEHVLMGPKFKYTNEKDVRRYPFTMGDSYTDSSVGTFVSGPSTYTRRGFLTETSDAWGTLQLPGNTYNGVLRIHYVDEMRDSAHLFPMFASYIRDVYEWWEPGGREYLLHVELLKIVPFIVGQDTISVPTVIYSEPSTNNIAAVISTDELKIYPVPARGELNIELPNPDNGTISLLDMMGKEITTIHCSKGQQQYKINTLSIPTGIYIIQINTGEGTLTRKVEIL